MLLEVLFEGALEFGAEFIGALVIRAVGGVFDTSEFKNPVLAYIVYMVLGGVVGGLSLLLFPFPLVHPSRIPGLSVILSPVLAGLGMSMVGSTLRKQNKKTMRLESFGYGFAFAFGMAVIRFLYIHMR